MNNPLEIASVGRSTPGAFDRVEQEQYVGKNARGARVVESVLQVAAEQGAVDHLVLALMLQLETDGGGTLQVGPTEPFLQEARQIDDPQRALLVVRNLAALACFLATQENASRAADKIIKLALILAPKLAPLVGGIDTSSAVAAMISANRSAPPGALGLLPMDAGGVGFRNR